ncbi:protein POLYCHOME-like [Senna tora]|uniref:Protein POLYCHOME-like n=1 Tax=Senna tora TaxID=362788 RepID=A0A834TK45_9FABA|nr:protein POLYCHOME-like [Senna tora]
MPEPRDRLSRPVDIAALFARRRANIIGILDDGLESALFGSFSRRDTTTSRITGRTNRFGTRGGRVIARRGRGRGRNLYGSLAVGVENTPPGTARRGRGRSARSALPSWYPRAPLRDITAITRAIERRRARLGENEGQQTESPNPEDQLLPNPSVSDSSAQDEHATSVSSSTPAVGVKLQARAAGKVPRILLDFTSKTEGEPESLTPQKKLLNSIDTVGKVVREEIQKFKRTPDAKKAEREKRVRTLMSMR